MRSTLLIISLVIGTGFSAQLTSASEPAIQQATHLKKTALPSIIIPEQGISFSQQRTQVGDRVVQRVGMELEMHNVIEQGGTVANDSTTAMRSRQEREIEVLEVVGGQARRARISYPLARQMSPENPQPDKEFAQVVEGKSYFVTRDGEHLLITDSSGAIPTREEFEAVFSSMENFGKPNPLAEFLFSRTIRIGDTLNVPLEIAGDMMGFKKMGQVKKFQLCLEELRLVDGRECAVFRATIATAGNADAPLRVTASGSVAIEIATTRTIEATLQGPVTMVVAEGAVRYRSSGELLMAVHSYYQTK